MGGASHALRNSPLHFLREHRLPATIPLANSDLRIILTRNTRSRAMLLLSLGPETLAALMRASPTYAISAPGLPDLSWLLFGPDTAPLPAPPPENPVPFQPAE